MDWGAFPIIGFSTSYQQNTASLALARRVKRRWPGARIVFGGANCREEMGVTLLRTYGFIDAVCLGEGETAFPDYVRRVLAGGDGAGVPGMIVRGDDPDVALARAGQAAATDMDALPEPDYTDFFAQHAASAVASAHYKPVPLLETARGCWWGQKHHCTFCGISRSGMAYRSKSPERAFAAIERLRTTYGPDMMSVDTILDARYYTTLLPRLAALPERIVAFYEIKANVGPAQVAALREAGIRKVQPGIESFSTPVLKLMQKGTTAIQNAQALKLFAEYGVVPAWNVLTGFPGETTEDYAAMAALLPSLFHLQPPDGVGRARADRFSPMQADPARFGITIRPSPAYARVYPFDAETLAGLAYTFEIDNPSPTADPDVVGAVLAACAAWREAWPGTRLRYQDEGDAVVVEVERPGEDATGTRLDGAEAAVLRGCWTITPRTRLTEVAGMETEAAVTRLEARGWVMTEGPLVLALPLRLNPAGRAPTWDEVRAA